MPDKIGDIGERISRCLQESLNELYLMRQEESGRLEDVKERARALVLELRDLAAALDKAIEDYEQSREELLQSSIRGELLDEKASYERASAYMKIRGSLEERHRLLSAKKSELTQEEYRLKRLVNRSENMGNRLRMVLNLVSMPEDFSASDDAVRNTETMQTAFHLAEREAITFARELHDGPTQTFAAVGLILETGKEYLLRADYEKTKEEIERALEQTRNGLDEIRAFLFNLNPTGIQEGFGFPLKRLASQLIQMWKCTLIFTLNGNLDEVPASARIASFKTLHQAVMNAARHGATEIKVGIAYSRKTLKVRVTDNGEGFDVAREKAAAKERGSYGLVNMEDRVKMLGGKISITSVLKKGSSVSFSIPILMA
ncbi:MAG: histidine kinase [Synergistaceae bacterium]|jgi:two-component system sensor histidine kinase DegS|nr:histidine kinase [Synergistaceae bacterium]